jgi:glutamine amidotransferase
MIAIVDFGMGNLGSIRNMLAKIGAESVITSDPRAIEAADKLILPGVGAFDRAMENLHRAGLVTVLNDKVVARKTPLLGICLGMQLLSRRSEEGSLPGLGWIAADTVRFPAEIDGVRLTVPHMGWNTITVTQPAALLGQVGPDPRFYFVHSYHVRCEREADVAATAHHGITFHAAVASGNIVGTQFHPEKSHKFGLALLRSFVEW